MVFYSVKEKYIFFTLPTILFCLLPLFLITGPFLSDLSISLISLLFLIYCYKKKNFSFFKNKFFYFFLFLWLYLIINSLLNNYNIESFKISFFYFRYGVFVIAIITYLEFQHAFVKIFFYCILICFTCLIIDGFYQYFNKVNIFGFVVNDLRSEFSRVSSFFGDELILGSYMSRLWPIFFGLTIILFKKEEKFYLFLILIFILSEVLIFLSGDRTAFFYLNLSAVFVILFSRNLLKLRLLTLIVSLSLIITISYFNPAAKKRVIDKSLEQMNLNFEEKDSQQEVYIFSKQHTHHYISAYKMFLNNKIFGVGVKNFRNFCDDENYYVSNLSCSTHPHNTYIQVLAEIGIIGFLFLILTLIFYLKHMLKHLLNKFKGNNYFTDFEICILSGISIYLWPFIPTGNFFNNWLNILMILNLPFLFWSMRRNKT